MRCRSPARTAVREGRHAWLQAWPPEHVPPHLPHQDPGKCCLFGGDLITSRVPLRIFFR